ncbi:MAG: universal stress protein [Propionibacteriaceae bacterium]
MTVVVAVPDSAEGHRALDVAVTEAQIRQTQLVVVNLTLSPLDLSTVPDSVSVTLVDRPPSLAVDELVLDTVEQYADADLLVIGRKRRSPVGKAVLGSLSQRLLLDSPIAVLAVKAKY